MTAALDHLVYAAHDLDAAVEQLTAGLGVRPSAGGQHVGVGTRNYLLSFGNGSYLEVIGPDDDQPAPPQPRPFGIDSLTTGRLVTWGMRVADLDAVLLAARNAGYDPGPARAMSRATPTGEVLSWRLTTPPLGEDGGIIPFLIDWGATRHPSTTATGGVTLASLVAEHPDAGSVSFALHALGAPLVVRAGPLPRLLARLSGPAGVVELS